MKKLLLLFALAVTFIVTAMPAAAQSVDPYAPPAKPLVVGPTSTVNNTYRWLDGKERNLGGMVYDGRDLVVTRNVLRTWDDQDSNIVIRNSKFRLKQPTTKPGDLPVALEFVGGHDILVENVEIDDFMSNVAGKDHQQGDCSSGEEYAYRVTYRKVHVRNCMDGGFDVKMGQRTPAAIKAQPGWFGTHFDDVSVDGANFCLRQWGYATATRFKCSNWQKWGPGGAVATLKGGYTYIKVLELHPSDTTASRTLFGAETGTTLIIDRCEGEWPKNAKTYPDTARKYGISPYVFVKNTGKGPPIVKLGPTCTPEGIQPVALPAPEKPKLPAGQFEWTRNLNASKVGGSNTVVLSTPATIAEINKATGLGFKRGDELIRVNPLPLLKGEVDPGPYIYRKK